MGRRPTTQPTEDPIDRRPTDGRTDRPTTEYRPNTDRPTIYHRRPTGEGPMIDDQRPTTGQRPTDRPTNDRPTTTVQPSGDGRLTYDRPATDRPRSFAPDPYRDCRHQCGSLGKSGSNDLSYSGLTRTFGVWAALATLTRTRTSVVPLLAQGTNQTIPP